MIKIVVLISCLAAFAAAKPAVPVLSAPIVAAPAPIVTATSSQYYHRINNGLEAYVAAPAAAYVAAPAAAYVAAPALTAPYVAAPALTAPYAPAASYVAAPYVI